MNIEETIRAVLEEEYRQGRTHQEIADAHNVSRSYIQYLLTGERLYGKLKVETVEQMFPRATLNLNGEGGITQVASNVRVNNGSVNSIQQGKSASAYRQEAIAAMIALDLPGDTLKLVLNTLMGIEA